MMKYIKSGLNTEPIIDTVFEVVKKAKAMKNRYGEELVIDATIGSFYNEEGVIASFPSVYQLFDAISWQDKTKYAESFLGNQEFRNAIKNWVYQNVPCKLFQEVIATPGGTGAIKMAIDLTLNSEEMLLIPEIGWGSYELMATTANIQTKKYRLFEKEHFNFSDFQEKCEEILQSQNKLVIIINDPCHNPTGYSLSIQEWKEIIDYLNKLSCSSQIVLINDIAYIDYSLSVESSRDYLNLFNEISDNFLFLIAFSCSKTMTAYGHRTGALLIQAQKEEDVKLMKIVMEKYARAVWSNINNASMMTFSQLINEHQQQFMKEKAEAIECLRRRSATFLKDAALCKLKVYPYKEGFFITVIVEEIKKRDRYHEALQDNLIFTVKVNKGIRVAICSIKEDQCFDLANRMKFILDQIS